jgi:hypothetical protein
VDGDAWYAVRSKFLTQGFDAEQGVTRANLAALDRALAAPDHDETVPWFEHDLFDQLLLIRI